MKKFLALSFALLFAANAQAQVGLSGYPAPGQLPGSATNDSANAGNVGEYISSAIVSGSAVALTTSTPANLTSMSLTAGDWDVVCDAYFVPAATTNITNAQAFVSTTSAANDGVIGNFNSYNPSSGTVPGVISLPVITPPLRKSLSATTTIFCPVVASFTVSTMGVYGLLRARRVR